VNRFQAVEIIIKRFEIIICNVSNVFHGMGVCAYTAPALNLRSKLNVFLFTMVPVAQSGVRLGMVSVPLETGSL